MDNNRGETSKQKNRNDSENDRPLKKARYLWQVKGKYHLKETNSKMDEDKSLSEENEENLKNRQEESMFEKSQDLTEGNDNLRNNNSNDFRDQNLVERLILSSEKVFEFPSSPSRNGDRTEEIPITLVKPKAKNEDFYLKKWQARQIAKGFVDNTINRVLETWMVAPFDATDFVENCDNDGQVEDEGILMAIQSHGLQSGRNPSSSRNSFCTPRLFNSSECSCTKQRTNLTAKKPVPFHSRYENMDQDYYQNLCVLKDTEPVDQSKIFNPNCTNSNSKDIFDLVHSEDSKENDPTLQLRENIQDLVLPNNNSYEAMDDTDFLDAAVSAAIQKKGLTSSNVFFLSQLSITQCD